MPAQQQSQRGDRDEQRQHGCDDVPDGQRDERNERADVQCVFARKHEGSRRHAGRQLEERHDRTGEGDRADKHADEDLSIVNALEVRRNLFCGERAVPSNEHGGQTDEAVQQRDELGHAGHGDNARPPQTDSCSDQQCDNKKNECRIGAGVSETVDHHLRDGCDQREGHTQDSKSEARA